MVVNLDTSVVRFGSAPEYVLFPGGGEKTRISSVAPSESD